MDLKNRGIRFLQDTRGKQLIPFEELVATRYRDHTRIRNKSGNR